MWKRRVSSPCANLESSKGSFEKSASQTAHVRVAGFERVVGFAEIPDFPDFARDEDLVDFVVGASGIGFSGVATCSLGFPTKQT
jgi:hypothetical protein